jgi:hypothetical protein
MENDKKTQLEMQDKIKRDNQIAEETIKAAA